MKIKFLTVLALSLSLIASAFATTELEDSGMDNAVVEADATETVEAAEEAIDEAEALVAERAAELEEAEEELIEAIEEADAAMEEAVDEAGSME